MKKIIALGLLITFASCSSTPDVRPGVDGIHSITVRGEDPKETEKSANKQAVTYCKKQKKTVEFLSNETFTPTSDEVVIEKSLFKKSEATRTDIKFKCN